MNTELPPDLHIRQATEVDAECISALAIHVFLDTYATDGVSKALAREVLSGYSAAFFSARLKSPEHCKFHVAEFNAHLLGFSEVNFAASAPTSELDGGLELAKLYVQPGFHNRGIGKRLLDKAEQLGLEQAKKLLWLTVWSGNTNAIGFYKHCNYHDIGRHDHIIEGQSYENRVFCKHLSPSRNAGLSRRRTTVRNT